MWWLRYIGIYSHPKVLHTLRALRKDPILFREGLQYIIKAKGFDLDVVRREKEDAA